ncbi:MAG: PAS domain-containing sensor histidine kinase [Acidobacteria bacterium]|nr:MAG: PAS domain-containing sensor histidine kinase [Acidobacteriota bacterium]
MSRKAIIVFVITTLITALVFGFSWIYLAQLLRQRMFEVDETASMLTRQLQYVASKAVPDLSSTRVDVTNPAALRRAIAEYLQTDANLNDILESVIENSQIVYDAAIVDPTGIAILDTNPTLNGKPIPPRRDLIVLRDAGFRRQLRLLYNSGTVYDVSIPLQLGGQPFGSVRVGVSTVFLRNELTPRLQQAAFFCVVAIFCSLVLSAVIANVALGPLKRIAANLDIASAGETEMIPDDSPADEVGLVSLKIAHLGRRIRDTNQIFSALKDNVEQVMANLQDGLMLFTPDSRVVLVSASAEKFLGRPRHEILGRTAEEIFSDGSPLGAVVLPAFMKSRPLAQYEFDAADNRRVQVSLDFIQEGEASIGALLTMRDVESVRRIEDEIEISRRLSASGRRTKEVAHEVKNPMNAIVLHLQLLQNKLNQTDPDTRRHMDVIGDEIHRLDRVVQTLVDFTRPRELHEQEVDMRKILDDVAILAAPDAEQHGVRVVREFPSQPLLVRVDVDLMKQAILNLVINGVQAMTKGGALTLAAQRKDDAVVAEIRDQGAGIPAELQEKVFELYFTTKKEGTGIGLAQTSQILDWHYGSVDFESTVGVGTTFRLRVPAASQNRAGVQREVPARS